LCVEWMVRSLLYVQAAGFYAAEAASPGIPE
jgi:hypothetical protein